ncbi:MAG: CapA family protein, partial [Paramuribaculum sp.]|nr:CapA family protein [Paramuribaculum sp.]
MMHQSQIDDARSGKQYDFSDYFRDIKGFVDSADYAIVNLETPVAGAPYSGYPCFNAPENYADALKDAGFDLFMLANNHMLDRRDKGLI